MKYTSSPRYWIIKERDRKMREKKTKKEITCEVIERIAVLSTSPSGWTFELNLVSWNGEKAKYDLRKWNPSHEKGVGGITLSDDEMDALLRAMQARRKQD